MTSEPSDHEIQNPATGVKHPTGLIDYFCPFCDRKLFRGKVNEFNMVCPNCNKLVRSASIPVPEEQNPEESNPEQF